MAIDHLVAGLYDYATHEQGAKSVAKALRANLLATPSLTIPTAEGKAGTTPDLIVLNMFVQRMCEPVQPGGRRATIVDLALSPTGSQLIANILPHVSKDQRAGLFDALRGHIVARVGGAPRYGD